MTALMVLSMAAAAIKPKPMYPSSPMRPVSLLPKESKKPVSPPKLYFYDEQGRIALEENYGDEVELPLRMGMRTDSRGVTKI